MLALVDPGFPRHMLGSAMMDTIERREMWTHSIVTIKPLASSAIMTNNFTVSFTHFRAGHHRRSSARCSCSRSMGCFSAWFPPRAGKRACRTVDELCGSARRARIARDFYCRWRGVAAGQGTVVSRHSASPRFIGPRGRPCGSARSGDRSDAHRCRNDRRLRLAYETGAQVRNTHLRRGYSVCCCFT